MNELSNNELSSYLQEINASEAAELPQDLIGSNAWIPNTTVKNGIPERGIKTRDEINERLRIKREDKKKAYNDKKAERRKQAREIKQNAISHSFADLNTPLTVEHKKLIIQLETKEYSDAMHKYEQDINTIFKNHIMMYTPKVVRACWDYYPEVIVPMEPFTYQASEDFGQGLTFRVNVDAPGYISADSLIKKLNINSPKALIAIDKKIIKFNKLKKAQSENEVRMANILIKIKTFFELVMRNPFWYDGLIKKLKEDATPTS